MNREYELKRRLQSLRTLSDSISALKSLSAHHFREARNAVDSARAYREGVQQIFNRLDMSMSVGTGAAGLLIVGGELGLCGSYNARLVEAGLAFRFKLGQGPTICVGHRLAILLGRRKLPTRRVYVAPTSVHGITELLLQLAEDILNSYMEEQLSSFDIISSRFSGVGTAEPVRVRLLPLMPESDHIKSLNHRYVSSECLAFAALREFLYITLYDLLLDALAAEHSARLAATQSAETWLEEQIAALRRHLAATRREASTQEVIEIATGARLRRKKPVSPLDTAGQR